MFPYFPFSGKRARDFTFTSQSTGSIGGFANAGVTVTSSGSVSCSGTDTSANTGPWYQGTPPATKVRASVLGGTAPSSGLADGTTWQDLTSSLTWNNNRTNLGGSKTTSLKLEFSFDGGATVACTGTGTLTATLE
jgi:hypothetical protein